MVETVFITLALLGLIAAMILTVRVAKQSRTGLARKHKAGFIIMASLLFGVGSMTEQPPPRAEEARNNTLEKKAENAEPKD